MSALAPLTAGRFFSTWRFDPWATATLLVLAASYLAGVRAIAAKGGRWPLLKLVAFLGLGLGLLAVATMSSIAVYARVLLWPAAVQITLLLTTIPIGLALGDPLGLVSESLPAGAAARWQRALRSFPVRFLTFPVVAPLLAVATQFLIFFTGYLGAAEKNDTVAHLLELQILVTGCLFALPLLGAEVLPSWCTQPVRMTVAAVDGLLDAIPGIAVMTSPSLVAAGYYGTVHRQWGPTVGWDQTIGGGLMLTLAEVVAVPFVAILYRAWIREDATHAAAIDRVLDAEEERRIMFAADDGPTVTDRPWWEVDPGPLADRASRYGWRDGP